MKEIKLCVESNPESISLIGPLINKVAAELSLPPKERAQMELCVVEAVNNSFQHSYKSQPGHKIDVDIQIDEGQIVFKVSDVGEKMNEEKLRAKIAVPVPDKDNIKAIPVKGRGLFIIHEWMSRVDYAWRNGRNEFTMTKKLKG